MCDGYAMTYGRVRRIRRRRTVPRAHWTLLRISLLLLAITTSIYITIPDYPWGTPAFMVLTTDPSGWLHELFYVWTFCLVGINLTYHFEKRSKEV